MKKQTIVILVIITMFTKILVTSAFAPWIPFVVLGVMEENKKKENNEFNKAIDKLSDLQIIKSPEYWKNLNKTTYIDTKAVYLGYILKSYFKTDNLDLALYKAVDSGVIHSLERDNIKVSIENNEEMGFRCIRTYLLRLGRIN